MADPRERYEDAQEASRIVTDRHLVGVWTAMPVKVLEDSDGHRARLQIAVNGQEQDRGGNLRSAPIAELGSVMIHFPSGGKLTATHPVKQDDEGMAVFQSRCIDGWAETGEGQEEPYRRRHELSDALYVPGFRNKPRQLDPAPSTTSYQIRTNDGKQYIELTEDGVCHIYATEVHVHAPKIWMDGNQRGGDKAQDVNEGDTEVEVKGTIHATGDITSDREVIARKGGTAGIGGQVSLATHRHTGVQAGGAVSGSPLPGS